MFHLPEKKKKEADQPERKKNVNCLMTVKTSNKKVVQSKSCVM